MTKCRRNKRRMKDPLPGEPLPRKVKKGKSSKNTNALREKKRMEEEDVLFKELFEQKEKLKKPKDRDRNIILVGAKIDDIVKKYSG